MNAIALAALLLPAAAAADDKPAAVVRATYQVTGLFMPDRVADLRAAFADLPEIKLVGVDYENAEATVEYDPKSAFPGAKPDDVVKQFDSKLRQATYGTFTVRPGRAVPAEKLQRVEVGIAGLDCKACSFAAYEIVLKVDGVERATASFKDGKVVALIDPAKTTREALVDALKKRTVDVKPASK